MSSFDPNYHIRTLYHLAHHQQLLSETKPPSPDTANAAPPELESAFLHVRSLIATKQLSQVLSLLSTPPSSEFKAAKILASYHLAKQANDLQTVEKCVSDMKALLADVVGGANPSVRVLAGELFLNEGLLEEAFKAVIKSAREKHLECAAILVQVYLRLDRLDLAQKEFQTITSWSLDSVLVQLIEAWVNLASGASKTQEAYYAFEELVQTYGDNATLLTSMAVCQIHLGEFAEADKLLNDAITKEPNNPDTLANLIVVSHLLNKPSESTQKIFAQLSAIAPSHTLVQETKFKSDSFDRVATRFSVS
ncbi:coatomer epsilon subunit-domain-containing protein [Paraphysoderma sedebokerense]|nr:coatomer epsilon subunit-domain-containing protein [Paraphysoderma sedebokerense]